MSIDERDPDNDRHFYSVQPYWREANVTRWLHDLDYIHSREYDRDRQFTNYRRSSSERFDHERKVVKGLPSNFYAWSYLDGLERDQCEGLNLRPLVLLEFHPSIERCVFNPFDPYRILG